MKRLYVLLLLIGAMDTSSAGTRAIHRINFEPTNESLNTLINDNYVHVQTENEIPIYDNDSQNLTGYKDERFFLSFKCNFKGDKSLLGSSDITFSEPQKASISHPTNPKGAVIYLSFPQYITCGNGLLIELAHPHLSTQLHQPRSLLDLALHEAKKLYVEGQITMNEIHSRLPGDIKDRLYRVISSENKHPVDVITKELVDLKIPM